MQQIICLRAGFLEMTRMLVFIQLLRHRAVDPRRVHRIDLGAEHHTIHVPDENRQTGQPGFPEVNGHSDIEDLTTEESTEEVVEPQENPCGGHDDRSPDQGPVLGLLDVVESLCTPCAMALADEAQHFVDEEMHIGHRRQHVLDKLPAAGCETVEEVPEGTDRHDDRCDAVDRAPHGKTTLPSEEELGHEALVVGQREPGHHQHNEADHQNRVLPDLVHAHTAHPRSACQHRPDLADVVQGVVKEHAADDDDDQQDIELLHPLCDRGAFLKITHAVNRALGNRIGDLGVALTAGLFQVGGIDRRRGIRTRKNAVGPMARGAVRNTGIALAGLQTVVGVDEVRLPGALHAIPLVEDHRVVAPGARLLGDLGLGHRRVRISSGENTVLAVAVGADRRSGNTALDQLAVDTLPVILRDRLVALAAGLRDILVRDRAFRIIGRQDLVGRTGDAVAVDAVGRSVGSAGTNLAVNAGFVHRHRVVVQGLVLGRDVQILVAGPAGLAQIG